MRIIHHYYDRRLAHPYRSKNLKVNITVIVLLVEKIVVGSLVATFCASHGGFRTVFPLATPLNAPLV
jgi:hypothetical protein